MNVQSPSSPWRAAAGLLVALGLLAGGPARAADHIDAALPKQADKVLDWLKKQGYQNVGVLKFRVQKGKQAETLAAGPMNVSMTTRLENSLVVAQEEAERPIGIIHNAGAALAARKEHANYQTADGIAKLFTGKYPLAWGGKTVDADCFLTGVVRLSADKAQTTVVIEAIDRKAKKPVEVLSFAVKTDRGILADLCESFVVNARKLRTQAIESIPDEDGGRVSEPDREAVQSAQPPEARADTDNEPIKKPEPASNPTGGLIELKILYNGTVQDQTPLGGNRYRTNEPQEGQRVTFRLKNTSTAKAAVVLAVNGVNTLYQESIIDNLPENCAKWILEPGKEYTIKGFYSKDGTKYDEFRVASNEESVKASEELNTSTDAVRFEALGAIQMRVFVENTTVVKKDDDDDAPKKMTQGIRILQPARKKTVREAARQVKLGAKTKSQGLILPGAGGGDADVKSDVFQNPQLQEERVIVYYDKKKTTEP